MEASWRTFALWFFVFYLAMAGMQLYSLFTPPQCSAAEAFARSGQASGRCFTPLFGSEEALDLYVYTSLAPGAAFDDYTLVYNASGLRSATENSTVVNVTLPPAVRQNGSLHAHAVLVRAGRSPDPRKHEAREAQHSRSRAQPHEHRLVASAPLTRWIPPIARNRSLLVGGAQEEEGEAADAPVDALSVIGGMSLLSALAALLPIEPATAAARYAGLVAIAAAAEAYRQDVARVNEGAEAARASFVREPPPPPTTHWKPRLRLRYSVDDATYPKPHPPVLYTQLSPPHRPVTYPMFGEQRAAPPSPHASHRQWVRLTQGGWLRQTTRRSSTRTTSR